MAIICVALLLCKKRGVWPYIRQIIIVILLFAINLRIMIPDDEVETEIRDIDAYVLFVVDDTISMLGDDMDGGGYRLDAVKRDCAYIIDELNGAKFAVVSFNNEANILSPYSSDGRFTNSVINGIYPLDDLYAKGSTLNVAYDSMEEMLKVAGEKRDNGAKVIVFFISDGEITKEGDKLKSFEGLEEYIDDGAVLGYGTKEGGNMYLVGLYESEASLVMDTSSYPSKPAVTKLDEGNLKDLADDLGIDYVHMTKQKQINDKLDQIINETLSSASGSSMQGYDETYYYFAAMLAIMLFVDFICSKVEEKYV